jgi:hypothetical protein
MAFGAVKPLSQPRKLMNVSGNDTSSNQQAIAVPYFAGVAKIPLTWISPPYNITVKKIQSDSGGKAQSKGGSAPARKKYRGDICGAICVCADDAPVDALEFVLVNDEIAFEGPLVRTPGQHYAPFTMLKYCQECRIYWGTKDSPLDDFILSTRGAASGSINPRDKSTWPIDTSSGGSTYRNSFVAGVIDPKSGHYDQHPGYRNVPRIDFRQFRLGTTKNMPNVVGIVRRGARFFSQTIAATDKGINPMPVAYEVLTDDLFGAGLPSTKLPEPSWQVALITNNVNQLFVSPLVIQASSLRSFFADYVQYYNGFFRTKGGTLEAGVFLTGNFDQSGLLTLGDDDLVGEPNLRPGSLDDTANYFAVVIRNRELWYNDDDTAARYVDDANFQLVGERRPEWVQRPHFIDAGVAIRYITAYGSIKAQEMQSGGIVVKRERVASLRPGDLFKLDVSSYLQAFLLRVLQVEFPSDRDGTVKLTVEREAGVWPQLYDPDAIPKPGDFLNRVDPITDAVIVELPRLLRDVPDEIQFAALAMRPNPLVVGFNVWLSFDLGVDYERAITAHHFAVPGRLVQLYPSSTPNPDTSVGAVIDLFGYDLDNIIAQSDQARDDDTLLLFFRDQFNFNPFAEIMSVGDIQAVGSGTFRVFGRRGRFNSMIADHGVGDAFGNTDAVNCWFVFRSELERIVNANAVASGGVQLKLQAFTEDEDDDFATSHVFTYQFSTPETYGPPAVSPGSGSYATTRVDVAVLANPLLTIRYEIDGSDADEQSAEWPKSGGSYTVLQLFSGCVLTVVGVYPDGRLTPLTRAIYTLVSSGGGTVTASRVYFSFNGTQHATGGDLVMSCPTAASTIHYSKNGVAYATHASPFTIALVRNDVVTAFASATGFLNSPTSTFDNEYLGGGGGRNPPP